MAVEKVWTSDGWIAVGGVGSQGPSGPSGPSGPPGPLFYAGRVNALTNPSFEVDTSGWSHTSGTGGTAALARTATTAQSGSYSGRVTWSVGTSAVSGSIWSTSNGATAAQVEPGSTYTGSMYVRCSKVQRVRLQLEFRNAANGTILNTLGVETVLVANTWTRLSVTATAPDLTVTSRILCAAVSGTSASTWAASDWLEADACMIERSSTVGVYFDGDSAGYSWAGTAHASPSYINYTTRFTADGTWTKPVGVRSVTVEACGAGGGGGGCFSAGAGVGAVAASGGGGAYVRHTFPPEALPNTVAVTVGLGGVGSAPTGASAGGDGTDGGTSSFGTLLTATGGIGGGRGTITSAAGVSSTGFGGSFGGTVATPDLGIRGMAAQRGFRQAAGASPNLVGAGGNSFLGFGAGASQTPTQDGSNAPAGAIGGGGGGSFNVSGGSTVTAGGKGADGIVIVTYDFG